MPRRQRATHATGLPVMTGGDGTPGRTLAVIALLLAAGAATRGYLPGAIHEPRRPAAASPGEMIALVVLLALSVAAVAVAAAHRMRHRRATAGSIGELSVTAGAHRGRPVWRMLLVGLAAILAWLLMLVVLAKLAGGLRLGIPAGLFGPHGDLPAAQPSQGTPAPPSPNPMPSPDGSTTEVFGYLLAAAVALVVLIGAGIIAARTRRTRHAPPPSLGAPIVARAPTAGETLVRAAELGLSRIADRSRGPREAIIACYAAMERHLADVPEVAPRDFDTPSEVLARAVQHHTLAADNASRLVEMFTEARFSSHVMTEEHRADAVEVLRLVLDELRSST